MKPAGTDSSAAPVVSYYGFFKGKLWFLQASIV
jgi:hypothetical protein